LREGMVKPRKQSNGTGAVKPTASFKKARRREVEKTRASTTDELGDTPSYSQKSHQTNDSSNLDIFDTLDVECALPASSILDILDVECVLPIVSGYLSRKEKMCFAISVTCVNGCEGQLRDSANRFGVEPFCSGKHCGDPICGCIEKMQGFKFCPDCERIFCGHCARYEEGNFKEMCDVEYCTIYGCSDCRSGKVQTCSAYKCHQRVCNDCGYGCKGCNSRFCGTERCYCGDEYEPECDCEGGVQFDY